MITPIVVKEQIPHQVGAYVVGEEIGRGSVAVVYRATDTLYDREVALKVLHPYFAHYLAFVRHFITEGRDAARLRHPNIVQVFEAGQADGVAYLAQDLISGGTLADMLQARGGPFTLDETIAVIEQVSAGLDHAHHLGHLHRNLKPSNILFADQGRVQIADFSAALPGLATTPANYPVGSPAFMAPEQARGEAGIDQRADIYSLGAIAYNMLTGRLPFEADNPLILLRKIIEEPAPAADRLNPDIDPGVAQMLTQVLAKKPNARFLTSGAFARALTHGDSVVVQREALPLPLRAPYRPTSIQDLPPVAPPQAVVSRAAKLKAQLAQRTILVLAMMGVTALLLLMIIAIRLAPAFFTRIAGQVTPAPAQIAVLTVQPAATTNRAKVASVATPGKRVTTEPVSVGPNGKPVRIGTVVTNTIAITATTPSVPPPTIRVLPTAVSTFTPIPVATLAPPFTPVSPGALLSAFTMLGFSNGGALTAPPATATFTATSSVASTAEAVAVDAGARTPAGRIAYTIWNPRTDRLDTVIYSLATGVRWPVLADKRQPDFNNQSDLALNGEGGNADNLLLVRPDGEILLDIVSAHAEDGHPHWAPNNKKIVFDSPLVGDGSYRLYLQHDDNYGQQVGPLMFDAWEIFGRYPIFLLDDRIAYNGCNVWENGSTCGIYVVDTYGGQPSGLTEWPRDIPTDNLGSHILAMSDRGGDWDVYWVDANSGAMSQLANNPGRDGLATASPDGAHIAFITDREGAWAVYVMQVDGSNQRKLFDLSGDYGRDDRDWLQERLSWGR